MSIFWLEIGLVKLIDSIRVPFVIIKVFSWTIIKTDFDIMNVNDHLNILTILIVSTLVVLSTQSSIPSEEMQISDLVREIVNKDYDENVINYRYIISYYSS